MNTSPEKDDGRLRTFATGATRDTSNNKPDYEGFFSPLVFARFGQYMHKHRFQSDGSVRDSDNWQKGIPQPVYVKSLWRHVVSLWTLWRGLPALDEKGQPCDLEEMCCAIMFNVMGLLHEHLKTKLVPVAVGDGPGPAGPHKTPRVVSATDWMFEPYPANPMGECHPVPPNPGL